MGARAEHPLDLLQSYRGINQLVMDMYTMPDKLLEFMYWLADYEVMQASQEAVAMGAGELPGAETIFFYNGAPPGLPPDLYDKLYIPVGKRMIDAWVERGFNIWCHYDNDQTPHLESLKTYADGIPKGHVLLDFEKTDMKKAKEVMQGTMCICGNVPSMLLVYGTPEEVDAYCKKLIEDCAPGGGFILGAECETPWDSKRENVVAMKQAAVKYGMY
jgi:uroporphyrinogen-III decarboxylase